MRDVAAGHQLHGRSMTHDEIMHVLTVRRPFGARLALAAGVVVGAVVEIVRILRGDA